MRRPRPWLRDGLFCLVFALAVVTGGGAAALSGLPDLVRFIVPPERVAMAVVLPPPQPGMSPQVLTPLPAHGFPDWLAERLRDGVFAGTPSPAAPQSTPASAIASAALPAIALVIDDLGPDVAGTRLAMALPAQVTLSFLPYGEATPALAHRAAGEGHEVLLHLPMEPEGADDPGPMALKVALPAAENLRRLDWALARIPDADGINNHMGSRFTADKAALVPVLEHLSGGGRFFLDSRTGPHSSVIAIARAFGVMSAGRDVFLDDEQDEASVRGQLLVAERVARASGVAIVIGHPHAVTLAVLKGWAAQLSGVRLIALREAVRMRTSQDLLGQTPPPPAPALAGTLEE